jgi:hypothetical protein
MIQDVDTGAQNHAGRVLIIPARPCGVRQQDYFRRELHSRDVVKLDLRPAVSTTVLIAYRRNGARSIELANPRKDEDASAV